MKQQSPAGIGHGRIQARLVPSAGRLPALRRDYEAMLDMYLSEPTPFDDMLATLADLENRINDVGGA
jgi:hypothetical protein